MRYLHQSEMRSNSNKQAVTLRKEKLIRKGKQASNLVSIALQ